MLATCEEVAVGLPPALVPGWADMPATSEEVAVGLPPALIPGWADKGATCEALPWESWSTLVAMVARAVVRVPSIYLTSIRAALSSGLVSSTLGWNSGGGWGLLLVLCAPQLWVEGVIFLVFRRHTSGYTENS